MWEHSNYYKKPNSLMNKNKYSLSELMKIIFLENPDISKDECYKKAKKLHKEIKKINEKVNRNTKKYYLHNIPLSYFEKDDEED